MHNEVEESSPKSGPGEDVSKKEKLTQEERIELAKKLDEDLDEFINNLEKRSYREGWKEDKWQEEMEKHPFFMAKQPAEGEELSPLMEGIQQLKYDSTENTPEELAATYKEDGNFNYKCKNYRMAIISYTEGLRQKCKDEKLNAQLHNNRAAAHYLLKNYRSCYNDCKAALSILPNYKKVNVRFAQASCELGLYSECLELVNELLRDNRNDKTLIELRKRASREEVLSERNKRRSDYLERKAETERTQILDALEERGITYLEGKESFKLEVTLFPEVFKRSVHFENNRLVWPVVLIYPEYKISDFIQEFHEDAVIRDQLEEVLKEPSDWDTEKKYTSNSVRVYHEDHFGGVHLTDPNLTLGAVLSLKSFRVDRGTPIFLILVKDSKAERHFRRSFS